MKTTRIRVITGLLAVGILLTAVGGFLLAKEAYDRRDLTEAIQLQGGVDDSGAKAESGDYHMPEDKGRTIPDTNLDLTMVEAGRLSENAGLQKAIQDTLGVSGAGYYFMIEMTVDDGGEFVGDMPTASLVGYEGMGLGFANMDLYKANGDLTSITPFTDADIVDGAYYVLVGYAEYAAMNGAQVHFYNSNGDMVVIYMDDAAVPVEPTVPAETAVPMDNLSDETMSTLASEEETFAAE